MFERIEKMSTVRTASSVQVASLAARAVASCTSSPSQVTAGHSDGRPRVFGQREEHQVKQWAAIAKKHEIWKRNCKLESIARGSFQQKTWMLPDMNMPKNQSYRPSCTSDIVSIFGAHNLSENHRFAADPSAALASICKATSSA